MTEPSPAMVSAAVAILGGPLVPVNDAAKRLFWPCQSKSSIHHRILAGTLPLPPRRVAGRWFIAAADLAVQLATPTEHGRLDVQTHVPSAAPHRGPGRPRKVQPAGLEGGSV